MADEPQIKKDVYDEAARVWNPGKVELLENLGIDVLLGDRSGYTFQDVGGQRLINVHINGGVFNLGHRNPEVRKALVDGSAIYDAGNHYFPSPVKNKLCEVLLAASPESMKYVAFNNGGGESIDAAVKFARHATKRSRIITVNGAFHGATGIATQAGDPDMAAFFHMTPSPEEFSKVDYDDLDQLEEVLRLGDTAAVLIESLPATAGFPIPHEDYLAGVAQLAHRYGALYIADEVQTGLMRSGQMWCCVSYGAVPDMIVTGKGLSGGYYPMSAVIMNERAGQWLHEDGFAHLSSFNAAELGCVVATKVVEITTRQSTKDNVAMLTDLFATRLAELQARHPDFFIGVRQRGVIMGLQTAHPDGGTALMAALYRHGVWSMRANFDTSVLQFKPGLLMSAELAEDVVDRLDAALGDAATAVGLGKHPAGSAPSAPSAPYSSVSA